MRIEPPGYDVTIWQTKLRQVRDESWGDGMLSSHSGCVKKVQLGYLKYAVVFLTMWVELVKSVSSVMWAILDSMASVELLEVT